MGISYGPLSHRKSLPSPEPTTDNQEPGGRAGAVFQISCPSHNTPRLIKSQQCLHQQGHPDTGLQIPYLIHPHIQHLILV